MREILAKCVSFQKSLNIVCKILIENENLIKLHLTFNVVGGGRVLKVGFTNNFPIDMKLN
jgi:hypothetical protein